MRRWLLPAVALPLIALDQATKILVRNYMSPGESLPLFWRFQLTYVQNTGSAFGLFLDQRVVLSIVGAVGIIIILLFYRFLSPPNQLPLVATSLVFAGAISNLIDRLAMGFVTDFIDIVLWYNQSGETIHWPMFNIADSAITIGSLILVYFYVFRVRSFERERGRHQP